MECRYCDYYTNSPRCTCNDPEPERKYKMKKKKTVKKLKPLSHSEHAELAYKVDSEGFFYYLAYYDADMEAIKRLGFDTKEVVKAVDLLIKLNEKIMEGMDYEYNEAELDD